jgi:hypothetical protein
MDAWRLKHVENYGTIKCLWKCIKLVTLLWYIMIHGQQNIKHTTFISWGMERNKFWQSFVRIFRLLQVSTLWWIQSELPELVIWTTFDQVNVCGWSLKPRLCEVSSVPRRHWPLPLHFHFPVSEPGIRMLYEELGVAQMESAECRSIFYYSHLQ